MSYNVSFMDTANNLYDVFLGVNVASNGLVGILILVLVFVISFASTIKDGSVPAFLSSGLLTSIIAILLGFAGLISWGIVIIPIMLLFTGLIIKFFQS